MTNTNRSKLLDSFFYDSQTWGALHKAWKGYVIAKNKHEYDRMEYYASVIQKLQIQLGLRVSLFPDIGMSALKFYSSKYDRRAYSYIDIFFRVSKCSTEHTSKYLT
jgi:hypothetical protein